jgi:hypothetical protein
MIYEIKPDDSGDHQLPENAIKIFLAGSIDMGSAKAWASEVIEKLKLAHGIKCDVIAMNPRRESWDSSWVQKESNPQFNHQVNWELSGIEDADIVFFNILPDSKSPITLMELGICALVKEQVIVCCPKEFYRSGNVQVVCSRYRIPLFEDFDSAIGSLMTTITTLEKDELGY